MKRGTTPTITYNFPFDVSTIEAIRINFLQGSETLFTKTETDCTFSGQTVSVQLTQEETYSLSAKKRIATDARYLKSDGTVGGTKFKYLDVTDTGGAVEILETSEVSNE